MRVLALDTTTRAGSVALVEDDRVVDERRGDGARTHALRMPGEIVALADAHRLAARRPSICTRVASGPGSFTGLRIGIATIQGLAFVHGRRGRRLSRRSRRWRTPASVDLRTATLIGAWMDAHRGDVFSALYRVTDARGLQPRAPDRARGRDRRRARRRRWRAGGRCRLRSPAIVHRRRRRAVLRSRSSADVAGTPRRAAAPRTGRRDRPTGGRSRSRAPLEPAAVRPLYVRRPDVEVVRDEKLRKAAGQANDT